MEYKTLQHDEIEDEIEVRLLGKEQSKSYTAIESEFGGSFLNDMDYDSNKDNEMTSFQTKQDENEEEYRGIHFLGDDRLFGCDKYNAKDAERIKGKILITSGGKCTFYTKAWWAEKAGAKGVLFINSEENAPVFKAMSAYKADSTQHKVTIPSATLSREHGAQLLDFLNLYDTTTIKFNKPTKETPSISSSISGVKINGKFVNNWIVFNA